jgi:hypothetical protein
LGARDSHASAISSSRSARPIRSRRTSTEALPSKCEVVK